MSRAGTPRILPVGDSALLIEFEDRIDAVVNARAVALAKHLLAAAVPGVRDIVPTFRSVAIYFDPLRTDARVLSREVDNGVVSIDAAPSVVDPIRIPVCYGGTFGPDLCDVAAFAGMTEEAVINLHVGSTYRVFMLGFLPGFAYMASLDPRIAAPRRTTPRIRVPAGSVGVAGLQTGIYPSESPGGWQLIGRTPVKPFDLERSTPFLFAAGDLVQFFPIEAAELERAATS